MCSSRPRLAAKIREEVDELTRHAEGQSAKGGPARQACQLHRQEHAACIRARAQASTAPADINALIDESLNLAYHGARAEKPNFNVTLQRDFDPAAGMIELFPQEITRVVLNLVSNGFYAVAKRKNENAVRTSIRFSRRPPAISATASKSASATTAPASRPT